MNLECKMNVRKNSESVYKISYTISREEYWRRTLIKNVLFFFKKKYSKQLISLC